MRKLTTHRVEFLKPVVLYLDDLEQIIEILHQVSDSVDLSTKDLALDNLKQLKELKLESLNELHISIDEPYLSLNLEPAQVSL